LNPGSITKWLKLKAIDKKFPFEKHHNLNDEAVKNIEFFKIESQNIGPYTG